MKSSICGILLAILAGAVPVTGASTAVASPWLAPAASADPSLSNRLALIEVDGEHWQIEDTSTQSANRIFETAAAMRGAR